MISQHWFRWWLGAVRQQAITWASVDADLCRQMASLGLNELTGRVMSAELDTFIVYTFLWTPMMYHRDCPGYVIQAIPWRHNERDGVSNHQPHDCLRNRLFKWRSKKTPKLRITGLCAHKGPVTREMFPFDDVNVKWAIRYQKISWAFGW